MTTPATYVPYRPFIDPYVLKCGHTFEREKAKDVRKCPTCKTKVNPEEASSNVALVKTQKVVDEIILALTETQEKHREMIASAVNDSVQKQIIIEEQGIEITELRTLKMTAELERSKYKEELQEIIRLKKIDIISTSTPPESDAKEPNSLQPIDLNLSEQEETSSAVSGDNSVPEGRIGKNEPLNYTDYDPRLLSPITKGCLCLTGISIAAIIAPATPVVCTITAICTGVTVKKYFIAEDESKDPIYGTSVRQ